jgi:hypothetical protein
MLDRFIERFTATTLILFTIYLTIHIVVAIIR